MHIFYKIIKYSRYLISFHKCAEIKRQRQKSCPFKVFSYLVGDYRILTSFFIDFLTCKTQQCSFKSVMAVKG